LNGGRPDAVVLDLNLHGKLPARLAETLVARRIPFVTVTGYGNRQFDIPALQAAPRLNKPVIMQDLVQVLSGFVSAAD
jgi:DNA-binding LytR/AlgR family response regulator